MFKKREASDASLVSMKTILYGEPKVGKTTAFSQLDGIAYIATERGHSFIDPNILVADCFSWADCVTALKSLKEEPGIKAVVIDTIHNFIEFAEAAYKKKENIEYLSDKGFGNGYKDVNRMIMQYLNQIESMGKSVHIIAHAKEKVHETKTSKVTVMTPKLSDGQAQVLCGFCDFIFYAYIDKDGSRKMRTKPTKHVVAGDRSGTLPAIMPLDLLEVEKCLKGVK